MKTSAYYYDNIVSNIDAIEETWFLQAIHPVRTLTLPKEYYPIMKARLLASHASNIQFFISSLLLDEQFRDFLRMQPVPLNGNEDILTLYFSNLSNTASLRSLKLVRLDVYNPEIQFNEINQKNIDIQRSIYHFDERVEYTALYKKDNKYYTGGYVFEKYGASWYISYYYSRFAGNSPLGIAEEISDVEEYLSRYNIAR
jgi:hypothetical protein